MKRPYGGRQRIIVMAKKKATTYCLECDARILIKSARAGQTVICNHCNTKLEVVDTDPVELDWYYEKPQQKNRVVYIFDSDDDDEE